MDDMDDKILYIRKSSKADKILDIGLDIDRSSKAAGSGFSITGDSMKSYTIIELIIGIITIVALVGAVVLGIVGFHFLIKFW